MDISIVKDDSGYMFEVGGLQSQHYTRRRTAIRGARSIFKDICVLTPCPTGKRGKDKKPRKNSIEILAGKSGLEYFRLYNSLLPRRVKQIERINRYIDEHPLMRNSTFEWLQKLIRSNERSEGLDRKIRGCKDKNLYDFIDSEELNRHRRMRDAI